MYNLILLAIFCAASGVLSSSLSSPCILDDSACLNRMANDIKPIVYAASPERDIESSDPMFVKEIIGDMSGFNFKFTDNTIAGFSSCIISNVKINDEITKSQEDWNCPKVTFSGKYDMTGKLLGTPAEGRGDYKIVTGNYFLRIESELKIIDSNNGKTHFAVKNFKLKLKPQEAIHFDFTNLFNGEKDLGDAFIKFANENSIAIAEFIQEPIWYAAFKKVVINFNKHLKDIPLEDMISN